MKTVVGSQLVGTLWRGGDKRGAYTMLDGPFRSALRHLGEEHEQGVDGLPYEEKISAAPLLYFDFVEVFGGAGRVSEEMKRFGFAVAPVLDFSDSKAYDVGDVRLLEWVLHRLATGRFRAIFLSPPCTSFSPAAYPAVRSYQVPKGWDRKNKKVLLGNIMAFRSLVIMKFAFLHGCPCALEQPRRSKMAWLPEWRSLVGLGLCEAVVASCYFGSPHQKEFRLLLGHIDAAGVDVRCTRDRARVKIEGKFTMCLDAVSCFPCVWLPCFPPPWPLLHLARMQRSSGRGCVVRAC